MKAIEEVDIKYYKYIYESWTQPTLTANGTMGVDDFAVSTSMDTPAYYAFDNDSSTYCRKSWGGGSLNSNITVYSKKALKVSSIYMDQSGNGDEEQCGGDIYASTDGLEYTKIGSFSKSLTQTITINSESYYNYFKFVNTSWNLSGYWNNRQITLSAESRCIEEASSSDYDFREEMHTWKTLTAMGRKYYKYVDWVQPVLTSNTSSNVMQVSATNEGQLAAFCPFDGNVGIWATSNTVTSGTLYINLYEDVYISSIKIQGYRNAYGYTKTVSIVADGTTVGSSQTFFTSTSSSEERLEKSWTFDEPVKPKKISLVATGGGNWVALGQVKIVGKRVAEATAEDYDFYKDEKIYKFLKRQ